MTTKINPVIRIHYLGLELSFGFPLVFVSSDHINNALALKLF